MKKAHAFILLILLIMAVAAPVAQGQRQRNYIYLFDCTQSMQTLGIWEPAKSALQRTVDVQLPQAEAQFAVVPFQDVAYPAFAFDASTYAGQREPMLKALDGYIARRTNTNIADALRAGFDLCRPETDNRVYLLTDGDDNVKKTPAVVELIRKWCASHTNTRLFYVTLDAAADNPEIRAAIDACDDAFMVNCHGGVIPQIADITPSEIYANTLEPDATHRIAFSEPGRYALQARCADPFFDAEIEGGCADGQQLRVRLRMRREMSVDSLNAALDAATDADGNYTFAFDIVPADAKGLTIANPTVDVVMSNWRPRSLAIAPDITDETVVKPGSFSYPAFLFSAAHPADAIEIDLAPAFNEAAVEAGSAAAFTLEAANGQSADYTLLYNGTPVAGGESVTMEPGKPAVLSIVFGDESATGKRYFTLRCTDIHLLERLNGTPASLSAAWALRTHYERRWNPLAKGLAWAGAALLAALALWFVLLRRMFFPTFAVSALEFAGPGSYYARKRVKSFRKVCLSSKRQTQSALSRIFTGKILFVRAEVWQPELTIVPGNKKTARAVAQKGWDIVPSRTLKRHETYDVVNSATGATSKLTVE
ncbi:MAG: VWA domain-containing protein [Muribaculaceae bacterium]|nr:VWA domain-containing protein [Muribaculaceae bacterium]MDE6487084.1 VWA domain-containing protein [Muribaculaceae bacterium]